MSVWDSLIGQDQAVEVLRHAATNPEAMTHAWLITGPPGSGRSIAARAFAAALQAPQDHQGISPQATTAFEGTHADVHIHTTEKLLITIDEAKELIDKAHRAPVGGRWRIVIVEDADRITERTSNVLLKSIEEPPPRTVWILCAPSAHDMLPTIRSRCRHISLRIPPTQAVADLLHKDGVDPQLAIEAAHASQSHIGVAKHLATNEQARQYRTMVLSIPQELTSVGKAVAWAAKLENLAKEQAKDRSEERDAHERAELLRQNGIEPGKTIPRAVRSQIKALEEEQKRRARRAVFDAVDRALVDLLSFYRDVLITQVGADVELINTTMRAEIEQFAANTTPRATMKAMEAITRSRSRFTEFTSISPLLALEALFIELGSVG